MTQSNEPSIEQMNEVIALFMGYEKVRVGYFGCTDDDAEYGETSWQVANEKWLEEMKIENIGHYIVNVKANEWVEWDDVKYHTSWDWLMPVCQKIKAIKYPDFVSLMTMMSATQEMNNGLVSLDLDRTHKGVYKFLIWYKRAKTKQWLK